MLKLLFSFSVGINEPINLIYMGILILAVILIIALKLKKKREKNVAKSIELAPPPVADIEIKNMLEDFSAKRKMETEPQTTPAGFRPEELMPTPNLTPSSQTPFMEDQTEPEKNKTLPTVKESFVFCPECNSENAVDSTFCADCGKELPKL